MDKKIELHIQFMKLFKKVLEVGIKLEKEIENPQKYGYIVSHADPHYDIFFDSDSTFMNMMNSKKIILQSKLPHDKIYYFMFILATIMNQDFVSFGVDDFIFEKYSNFLDFNPAHDVDDEGIDYDDPVQYMNLLLQETGNFWIDHCGHRKFYRPPHCIYDFRDSTFERFLYMDGKYCQKITTNKIVQHPDGTKETQKIDNFIDYMSSSSMKKTNQERILYNLRKASPFCFDSPPDIIEYTLPMMLHYVQQQIDLYEVLPTFTLLNEDIKIKGKTPFMIQKYINMGLSIEEVLEAVGY